MMFSRLRDQIKASVYGSTNLKWTEIVETFALKYPQVQIVRQHLEGIPEAFVVWRSSEGYIQLIYIKLKKRVFHGYLKLMPPIVLALRL